MNGILTHALVFIFGLVCGAVCTLSSWEAASQRGVYEISGKVYRVERIAP
jgi:hypothetical protein